MIKRYDDFGVRDFVLDDYFRKWVKEPSVESEQFWDTWLLLHPHKKGDVLEARRILVSIDFRKTDVRDIDVEALLHRIRTTIKKEASHPVNPPFAWQWQRWVAALLVFGITSLTLYYYTGNIFNGRYVSCETPYGKSERVVLPDQSVVILNTNSSLHYTNDWNDNKVREVWLQGEAFFEVRKSPGKGNARFIVHTDQLTVEVLGTEFNVANRRGTTRIVLNSGKVKLHSDRTVEKEITMVPGELAELSNGQAKFTKKAVNPEMYSSWTEGRLIFDKTPFKNIVRMLEDNYGYQVHLEAKEIEEETFTGIVPSDSEEVVLNVLAESYGVKIAKSRKELWITRKEEIKVN